MTQKQRDEYMKLVNKGQMGQLSPAQEKRINILGNKSVEHRKKVNELIKQTMEK